MGHERWFRGERDGQKRPLDWSGLARQYGIAAGDGRRLYEEARRRARTHRDARRQEEVIYRELLEAARDTAARPSPGKVTRTMRETAERAGKPIPRSNLSPLTGRPIAPGKRTLTSYLPKSSDEEPNDRQAREREVLAAIRDAFARTGRAAGVGLEDALTRHFAAPQQESDTRATAPAGARSRSAAAERHVHAAFAIATGNVHELDARDRALLAAEAASVRWVPGDEAEARDRDELGANALDTDSLDEVASREENAGEHGAGPRGELPFRDEMERLFGERLDDVFVEQRGGLPRGAVAAAERDRIAFAEAAPTKATVAHEVAHVLQYRRGAPRTAAPIGERGDPAEHEARHAAAAVLAGRSIQIRGTPTAQMHLQDPDEPAAEEADHEITVVGHAIDFTRHGDGLQVEVMWYALLLQEGREHRPLRQGEPPPQFTEPRLRATRLVLRLEEHTGVRMRRDGRQDLLERREIPLMQRDPYSYVAVLSAGELRQWFGVEAWQGFLDGRRPAAGDADAAAPDSDTTPTITVEEVLRHLAEERWDVDSLAAQLTDGQMRALSPADRVGLIDFISGGFSVLNEDEHTIVRLLGTTPPEQARAVRDQLGTRLLQQLDGAIDFDDYRDYNDALRRLFFASLAPDEAAEQMASARIFPWANPGVIHAMWNVRFYYEECELHDDGKVHISYWTNLAFMGMRSETVQLDPFEMIAVRFYYPEEHAGAEIGQTIYMPAINLRSLHRHQFKGELQTVVDVGLLAAGGAGLVGASTRMARVIAALDLAVGAADITIRDFRHEIAQTEGGRDFLAAWDVVSTLIAAYGILRLATHAPAALRRLRSAFGRFRDASPSLPADTMRRIESEVEDVLRQADQASEAAAVTGRSSQASGAHDAVDTAVRRSVPARVSGFSATESAIIHEARSVLESSDMAKIRAAHESGRSITVTIQGRLIQYEPDLPASGMTMFGENGFLIGREAFASEAELCKTVLHELHRLATSQSAGGVSGKLAAEETAAAATFAERAFEVLFQ